MGRPAALYETGEYPDNCLRFEFDAARMLADGLLPEIEKGLPGYYFDYELIINCHIPGGCSEYSLDAGSYDAFYDDLMRFFFDESEFYKEDIDIETEKYQKMLQKFGD